MKQWHLWDVLELRLVHKPFCLDEEFLDIPKQYFVMLIFFRVFKFSTGSVHFEMLLQKTTTTTKFERAERIFQHLILETEFGCLWPHNALN